MAVFRIGLLAASLVCLQGCEGGDPTRGLDLPGRMMLDPIRVEALKPDELVARLRVGPRDVVADVGAGVGFLTLPLLRVAGRVIATDLRADYLEVARRRARRAGLPGFETRVVPADRPSLPESGVDLALLCQVDHALADRAGYFAQLKGALKPGGRIALVNYRRYRAPDLEAARVAGLRVVDEWDPSPPFFVLVLKSEKEIQ
jgi:SAM-dependent methyltransferase